MTPDDNQLSGHARIGDPVRADGYSPITNPTWVWARITGRISAEHLRIVWNAARRLDAAHRQFEHLRNSLDLVADATPGSIEWRLRMFNTLGDAELAVIALSRALQLTVEMPNLFPSISVPLPRIVKRRARSASCATSASIWRTTRYNVHS